MIEILDLEILNKIINLTKNRKLSKLSIRKDNITNKIIVDYQTCTENKSDALLNLVVFLEQLKNNYIDKVVKECQIDYQKDTITTNVIFLDKEDIENHIPYILKDLKIELESYNILNSKISIKDGRKSINITYDKLLKFIEHDIKGRSELWQ